MYLILFLMSGSGATASFADRPTRFYLTTRVTHAGLHGADNGRHGTRRYKRYYVVATRCPVLCDTISLLNSISLSLASLAATKEVPTLASASKSANPVTKNNPIFKFILFFCSVRITSISLALFRCSVCSDSIMKQILLISKQPRFPNCARHVW
jgi:hypothetical protein